MDRHSIPDPETSVRSVPPETLHTRIEAGEQITILDTRQQESYEEWHIDGPTVDSINIPYTAFLDDGLDPALKEQLPTDTELLVVCGKGISSEFVAGKLAAAGYDARHVADGMDGWAKVYQATPIEAYGGPGTVLQYHRPSSGCLSYLVCVDGTAAVIDPLRAFTDRYHADATARGATLTYAIDTHIHADHVSGVRALAADSDVTGILSTRAVARGVTDTDTVTTVADGDELQVGSVTMEVVATPGHTTGMTSYRIGEELLLTGDCLFVDSVARPDLEAGSAGAPEAARQLHTTLHDRILSLPESTLIAGGHIGADAPTAQDGTYTACLKTLRDRLPVLTLEEDAFVTTVLSSMPPRPANYETIIDINLGVQVADDEEAFELELGPNNCAVSTGPVAGD